MDTILLAFHCFLSEVVQVVISEEQDWIYPYPVILAHQACYIISKMGSNIVLTRGPLTRRCMWALFLPSHLQAEGLMS